jgi:hypothetical protein
MATGVALMIDDIRDLGRLGSERNPPIPHHWIYGLIVFLGGAVATGLGGLMLLQDLKGGGSNPTAEDAKKSQV